MPSHDVDSRAAEAALRSGRSLIQVPTAAATAAAAAAATG